MGWQRQGIPLALFLHPSTAVGDAALGAALAILLIAAWEPIRRRAAAVRRFEARLRAQLGGLAAEECLALALLSALSEELFFRGAVQHAWGIWPATILFGLLHLGRDPGQRWWAAAALLSGAALGGLVAWRGTLLPAIVAHLVVNAVQLRRLLVAPAR